MVELLYNCIAVMHWFGSKDSVKNRAAPIAFNWACKLSFACFLKAEAVPELSKEKIKVSVCDSLNPKSLKPNKGRLVRKLPLPIPREPKS